jgi:hypothetical protein
MLPYTFHNDHHGGQQVDLKHTTNQVVKRSELLKKRKY